MNTLSCYRMEVKPDTRQTPGDCVDDICELFSQFVVGFYRQSGREIFPLNFDGGVDCPKVNHTLITSKYDCSRHTLATVDWWIVPSEDPDLICKVTFVCAADQKNVELQYRMAVGFRSLLLSPGKYDMKTPVSLIMPTKFLHSVVMQWSVRSENWPIPVATTFLIPSDMEAFVRGVLLNPKRSLPVVMLAADGRFKSNPESMQDLQRLLLGAAHVTALTSRNGTESLEKLLGPTLGCSRGVLRIYFPMLTRESPPQQHPEFRAEALQKKKLELFLHNEVMKLLRLQDTDGRITCEARAAVCREFSQQRRQLPELVAELENAEEKIQSVKAQTARIREARDEANQSVRSMKGKLAAQTQNLSARAGELLEMRDQLQLTEHRVTELVAEHSATLEILQHRERELVQTKQHNETLCAELLKRSAATPHPEENELDNELNRAWMENDNYLKELESARREIAARKEELADCKKNLELLSASTVVKPSLPPKSPPVGENRALPCTVMEALTGAAELHEDILEIWEGAWKSAKESHFPGPIRVMDTLGAIAEVGRSFFRAVHEGRTLGPLDQVFRSKIPFKYAPSESHMTMAMFGHERLFQGPNQRREIQRHLTLGGGGEKCLQVYFDFDEVNHRVVIAYCGRHLSHYRQA